VPGTPTNARSPRANATPGQTPQKLELLHEEEDAVLPDDAVDCYNMAQEGACDLSDVALCGESAVQRKQRGIFGAIVTSAWDIAGW
jgi:hypothetical protein